MVHFVGFSRNYIYCDLLVLFFPLLLIVLLSFEKERKREREPARKREVQKSREIAVSGREMQ